MRRPSLRRRLYTVLLQWFLLLVIAAGGVMALSFSRLRDSLVDDRLLLARTVAQSLDVIVSGTLQDLGRLAEELRAPRADAAARLRAFRFQSPFRAATYVLDGAGRRVVSDPPDARPLPAAGLPSHEAVTALVRKPDGEGRPVLVAIRPFRRGGESHHLVAEMDPAGSALGAFLQDLRVGSGMHVVVVDVTGTVLAAADERHLFRSLSRTPTVGERIRAHRPLVEDGRGSDLAPAGEAAAEVLTVMVPLRLAPWGVVVQQRRTTALGGLYDARLGLAVAAVILGVAGLLLARALSRSVVRPIQELSREAEALGAGDLSRPIRVSGDYEVEVLARTLDAARRQLAATLGELETLNESLEAQVATRTRAIEARYLDVKLLHAVAQLATQEREPDRVVPEILRLIAAHYGLAAVAMVVRPPEGPAATWVVPPEAAPSWLGAGAEPPPDWQRHSIEAPAGVRAELFHPRVAGLDEAVMAALERQIAASLDGAYLWQRTLEQDEQRRVLVRRLLGAAEEERRRLARELHDEIAQLLTVVQLSLDHVAVDSPDLQRATGLLAETQREIHRIIHDLGPSVLDHLGLAAAVRAYAEDHLVRHGLTVSLEVEERRPSRPEVEIAVFRVFQELVTNVLRHAKAEHVSVELYEREGTLVLAVEDDGAGFDPAATGTGVGLAGMRERAALVHGTLRIDSEPGMGTHAVLEVPLS